MLRCTVAFRTAAVLTLFMIQGVFGGETYISIVPIGTGPGGELAPGVVIDGNAITLTTDGINPVPVFLEVRIGDWDPNDTGVQLSGYQPAFDSSSLTTGASGALTFNVGSSSCGECSDNNDPCTIVEECTAGTCEDSGDPCHVPTRDPFFECPGNESCLKAATCDGGVIGSGICESELGTGSLCGPPNYFLGSGTCSFAYVDTSRPDWALVDALSVLPVLDVSSPDVRPSYAVILGPQPDPEPFPVEGLYAATIALLVPPDAQGTFTISLKPFPASTLFSGPGLKIEGACSGTGELCYTGGIECASADDTCNGLKCIPSNLPCRFDCRGENENYETQYCTDCHLGVSTDSHRSQ
ncbi:MAG: hypothetical protein IID33_14395 [Planctomycetes bacterium]|nr:hypothetical protein [Planctomycetota bacterium]